MARATRLCCDTPPDSQHFDTCKYGRFGGLARAEAYQLQEKYPLFDITIPPKPERPEETPVFTPTSDQPAPAAPKSDRQKAIEKRVFELNTWWVELHAADIKTTAPKAVEYGAADLAVMGAAMEHLIPAGPIRDAGPEALKAAGMEMAVAFYALGKVARLFGAYEQGRMPSDDTWFDLAIYTGMARKIRATGGWV
jgi:hypothetical protein